MTRKERKKGRKRLEETVEKYSEKLMNDFCKHIEVCMEPYCWRKFGNYHDCPRYLNNLPRLNSNEKQLYS